MSSTFSRLLASERSGHTGGGGAVYGKGNQGDAPAKSARGKKLPDTRTRSAIMPREEQDASGKHRKEKMSKFSEECKRILEENGTNVYRLSSHTGLERTTLQRMITGKRLPHIEFVKEFCKALRFCGEEEKRLMELYQMECIGEATFRNRQIIYAILKALGKEPSKWQEQTQTGQEKLLEWEPAKEGRSAVWPQALHVLKDAFAERGDSCIYTNFPVEGPEFFQMLGLLQRNYPQTGARVFHIISFQTNARETLANLKALYHMVPFALSGCMEYASFYCYSRRSEGDMAQMMFPYYIVTGRHALSISGDMKNAVLHTEPEVLQAYQREAQKLLGQAKKLLHTAAEVDDAWEEYNRIVDESPVTSVFSPQPCFRHFLSQESFLEKAERCPSQVQAAVGAYMEQGKRTGETQPLEYYTKEGLRTFMETGRFQAQAASCLLPLSQKERIWALERFLKEEKNQRNYLLKENLRLPANVTLELHGRKRVLFVKTDDEERFSFLVIEESSICEAFEDFAVSLAETEEVCTLEEQREFVEALLRQYQVQKTEHSS